MSFRTLIDAAQLSDLMAARRAIVFDCRFDLAEPAAAHAGYLAGHIPGALYLNLERDLSAAPDGSHGRHPLPDRHGFARRMAATGLSRNMQVVAYDVSGGFYASRLWWMLRWAGHEVAAVLDGGLATWVEAGLPVAAGSEPELEPGDFTASRDAGMASTDAAALLDNIAAGELLVVDARSAERFRGEPHPLDPVSGHIPGARNRFFQRNLSSDGRFKPAVELEAEFSTLLGGRQARKVVHQCGSGVTATHNILAMEIAGLDGSRLYPGSWSEWVSDPSRPIATGAP